MMIEQNRNRWFCVNVGIRQKTDPINKATDQQSVDVCAKSATEAKHIAKARIEDAGSILVTFLSTEEI